MGKKATQPEVSETPDSESGSKKRERKQVDLDADLKKKIDILAVVLEITAPDYVNARLRVIVDEEYNRVMKASGLAPDCERES